MPPHYVPTLTSDSTTNLLSLYLLILLVIPFASIVMRAEHTLKALLDDTPAAVGTMESMYILRPFGFFTRVLISGS